MYNPKIYIRDYGSPTLRMLAFWGSYLLTPSLVDMRRDLIVHADNPFTGDEFILLSGDMQSGSDVEALSGSGDDLLVITNPNTMRFFGTDVVLLYSNITAFPSWAYDLVGNDAGLKRNLITQFTTDVFAQTNNAAELLRSLPMTADIASFVSTFNDAVVSVDSYEAPIGDAQSGSDAMLLSGDAQSGTDFLRISQ